jgi:hypothetical protein
MSKCDLTEDELQWQKIRLGEYVIDLVDAFLDDNKNQTAHLLDALARKAIMFRNARMAPAGRHSLDTCLALMQKITFPTKDDKRQGDFILLVEKVARVISDQPELE